MSVALDSTNNRIIRGLSYMMFESPEKSRTMSATPLDQSFPIAPGKKEDELDSCSSSSIGRNSDLSAKSDSDGEDDGEVQSTYKGPLDTLDALEEVLPIRRGISKFYSGKSKSFTSLADATSSSIKEIAKPENSYTRKRKNLIATSIMLDKQHNSCMVGNIGGISKRLTSSKRLTFNLTGTPSSSSESITSENSNTSSSSPPRRPPLHPQPKESFNRALMSQPSFSSRRAFSLMDLQIANDSHCSSMNNRDENKKHH